jgi:hypothetical protein
MEDDLKKREKNGRRPPKKGRQPRIQKKGRQPKMK